MILLGDCLERLKELPDNSVDSVVTDPPYGLKFMNKHWDISVPSVEVWREVIRVLKPGGHLLSFGGTRTYHRMACAIEDAGFEIRDQIVWLYGSGFPKSQNISIQIDKQAGAMAARGTAFRTAGAGDRRDIQGKNGFAVIEKHEGITENAKRWQGWGTALKPANEPIVLARKPLEKGLTVAQNVLKWNCGGLNIDASRVGYESESDKASATPQGRVTSKKPSDGYAKAAGVDSERHEIGRPLLQGRWPANLILDEAAAEMLDEQSIAGGMHSAGKVRDKGLAKQTNDGAMFGVGNHEGNGMRFGDSGGASRFFYCAKASKSERNMGLEGEIKEKQGVRPNSADASGKFPDHDHRPTGGNNHPTVKPLKLMEYLITLVTPPGGTVLDCFMGSGSTGVAAFRLGYKFIGCEMNAEYAEIAEKRMEHAASE